ncbi:MAG: 23S rRNA (pseudouridine(1915)-N(3))-methyltransferase RlmH [Gammaproteobacteria bacterium]
MNAQIIAVGQKVPAWVAEGYKDYAKRFPRDWVPRLVEIATPRRNKGISAEQLQNQEWKKMSNAVDSGALLVALDVIGKPWTTEQFSKHLELWRNDGRKPAFLIGGPDGLASSCLERASYTWSLSALTLPHALVRVVLIEQIYRAWSMLANHPYHRA